MTSYTNAMVVITRDGHAIVCYDNGYDIRTLESGFGVSCLDPYQRDYGRKYWRDEALKKLGLDRDDVVMTVKGDTIFKN